MSSIYRDVLGDDFARLHPRMQWRFGLSSTDGTCQIGSGVMDEVWRGPWWTLPFLLLGSTRRILVPGKGRDVPFTIANYAYVDSFGRETVTWARRFRMKRSIRAFDATMVDSSQRGTIIDYLGTHQHLAVDIRCSVDDEGALCLRTGAPRCYEGRVAVRFPLWLSGAATVREWWDDVDQRFRISVRVENRVFGPLCGYHGSFTVKEHPCAPEDVPLDVKPIREERRE